MSGGNCFHCILRFYAKDPFVVCVLLFAAYVSAALPFSNEMKVSDDQGERSLLLWVRCVATLCAIHAEFGSCSLILRINDTAILAATFPVVNIFANVLMVFVTWWYEMWIDMHNTFFIIR